MVYGGIIQETNEKVATAKFQAIGLDMNLSEFKISAYYDLVSRLAPYIELNRDSPKTERSPSRGGASEMLEFARKFREEVARNEGDKEKQQT